MKPAVPMYPTISAWKQPSKSGINKKLSDDVFKDVNSVDKTLMEKFSLIDGPDKKEKAAFFTMFNVLAGWLFFAANSLFISCIDY